MTQQYQRGLQELRRINPDHADESIEELKRICPDLAEYFVTFGFGEVYSRPALDAKTKALVAIGSLTALGYCEGFLKTHVQGAIHAGCSREEILEVVIQSIVFIGFPAALAALRIVTEAFATNTTSHKTPNMGRGRKSKSMP